MSVGTTTPFTIPLTLNTVGSVVDSYVVMWKRAISEKCHDLDEESVTITNGTNYTVKELQGDSNYTITVTATNAAGSAVSVPVTAVTGEAGEGLVTLIFL